MTTETKILKGPGIALLKERGLMAITLAGIVFFVRPLFLGETFFYRDLYLYFLPIKKILADTLLSGELPFWNIYLHGGQPLLAEISSVTLYPSMVLYLFLPVAKALSLDIVIHALASAAALYLLARRLGSGPATAALAALVYGYCGFTLSQANLYFRLLATPYLPLMLVCWDAFLLAKAGPRRRWLIGLTMLGALQVLAGSGEMLAYTWLTLLGWGLARSSTVVLSTWRIVVAWGLAGLVVGALAAPQLLPLLEMIGQSQRGDGLAVETTMNWSLNPRRLPEWVLPGFMGRTDVRGVADYWGREIVDTGFPFMLSLYVGALALALALLGGLRCGRLRRGEGFLPHRIRSCLLALWVISILLALGRWLPLSSWLFQLPGLQLFRYPVKFINLGILPMALLAAEGAVQLFGSEKPRGSEKAGSRGGTTEASGSWQLRLPPIGWVMAVAMLVGWLLLVFSPNFTAAVQVLFFDRQDSAIAAGLRAAWSHMTLAWLAALLALTLSRTRRRASSLWVLTAIVGIDLMVAGWRINPTAPIGMVTEEPPIAKLVKEQLQGGRFYRDPLSAEPTISAPGAESIWLTRWSQEVLRFYLAASYDIPVIFHTDYNGLAASRVMKLKWTIEALPWTQRLPLLSAAAVRVFVSDDEISMPGVERLASISSSGQPFHVYRFNDAANKIELIAGYRHVVSEETAVAAMLAPGFDPRQHAVVEGELPAADLECRGGGRAEMREQSSRYRRISVTSECPRLLVLSEVWYPGWVVQVDGEAVPHLRANAAFSAVWLTAGEHQVEWRYIPKMLYLGFAVSLVTLAGLAVLSFRSRAE